MLSIRAMLAGSAMESASPAHLEIGLREGVSVDIGQHGIVLRHPWGAVSVGVRPEVGAALLALQQRPLDAVAIAAMISCGRPFEDAHVTALLAQLDALFNRLPMLVTVGLSEGTDTLVRLEPISDRAPPLALEPLTANLRVSLDRFAYLRRRSEVPGLCLESPLSLHRAEIGPALLPLIPRLATAPMTIDEIDDPRLQAAIRLLVAANLIHAGAPEEVEEERLSTWSFHDLLFHAHSRPGRSDELYGAHFRHRERFPALPAVPPATSGPAIDLPSPRFADVVAGERSLTEVIESRQSVRSYAEEPITLEQLGELLYRSARTRRVVPVRTVGSYDGADHPYPTGGLAGDLELYLSVARCTGLEPGIYHYEAAAHRLRLVNRIDAATPLLTAARNATGGHLEPQVLLTITSRFARISWKYDAIAYALTLKHLGALLQTIYLVATSMGLAPCALGSGDADRAARAFGTDWLVESSVGELALGSRREPIRWASEFVDMVSETRSDEAP